MPAITVGHPRADVVARELPDVDPFRSVYAVWRSGRRVPAIPPMLAALDEAAAARLGSLDDT